MKVIIPVLAFCVSSIALAAAPTPLELIKQRLGCFEVTYRYVDNGAERDYHPEKTIEEFSLTQENPDGTLVIANKMVNPPLGSHWHEIWKPTAASDTWNMEVQATASGKTRYACKAHFVRNQWSCETDLATKPQRDVILKRTDYDHLRRSHVVQITLGAWVQSENNEKHTVDHTIVNLEVGWNEYRRVDAKQCAPAPSPTNSK